MIEPGGAVHRQDKIFKSGPSEFCARQPYADHIPSNFLKAAFYKI